MISKILNKIKQKKMHVQPITDIKLNKYLSNYNCNNCHNHCSLNKIKCGRGLEARTKQVDLYKM